VLDTLDGPAAGGAQNAAMEGVLLHCKVSLQARLGVEVWVMLAAWAAARSKVVCAT